MFSLCFLCPIWKTLDCPQKHDNTHRAEKEEEEYALHWDHQRKGRGETEKTSTGGWKRDVLLIVYFGSLHCDICKILCVLNFLNFCFTLD